MPWMAAPPVGGRQLAMASTRPTASLVSDLENLLCAARMRTEVLLSVQTSAALAPDRAGLEEVVRLLMDAAGRLSDIDHACTPPVVSAGVAFWASRRADAESFLVEVERRVSAG
jgi:hypothetical protein